MARDPDQATCFSSPTRAETCIKYVKKKLEAKQSLRSTINVKRRRCRGKPLLLKPCIADTDDRNQRFRCQAATSDAPGLLAPIAAHALCRTPCLRYCPGLHRDTLPPLLPQPLS